MQARSGAGRPVALCLIGASLLLLGDRRAGAQINFVFLPDTQTAAPGTTVTYSATVTNTGATSVFINADDQAGFAGPGIIDDTFFYQNFTGSLAAGQSITDKPVLSVLLDSNAAYGDYLGTFDIKGGSTATANNTLLSAPINFRLTVTAVPEASSLALLALGAGSLTLVHRLRFRRRASVCHPLR